MAPKRFFPTCGRFAENATLRVHAGTFAFLLAGLALAAPAHAQATHSALASIDLPAGARDWSGDDDGSKQATLDFAASLAGVGCGEREARVWSAASSAAADDLATRTNTALLAAGWTLEPLSRTPDGQRIMQMRRANDRLVMVWQPGDGDIGLLLCRADGAVASAAEAAPESAPSEPAPEAADSEEAAPAPENALPRASRIDDAFGPAAAPSTPAAPAASAPSVTTAPEEPAQRAEDAGPPAKDDAGPAPATVVEPQAQSAAQASGVSGLPALVLAVLALVAGGAALVVRDLKARRLDTAWQWPTVSTTIERGWIEEEEDVDRRGAPVTSYLPVLKYRYKVDGEEHEGSQIGLDDAPLPTAEAARSRLAKYPDFTTVEIRYDPQDPAFAVIEAPRPRPGLDFYFGIAAIVIAVAVLLSHFF